MEVERGGGWRKGGERRGGETEGKEGQREGGRGGEGKGGRDGVGGRSDGGISGQVGALDGWWEQIGGEEKDGEKQPEADKSSIWQLVVGMDISGSLQFNSRYSHVGQKQ